MEYDPAGITTNSWGELMQVASKSGHNEGISPSHEQYDSS